MLLLLGLAVPWLPRQAAPSGGGPVLAAESTAVPELTETPVPVLLNPVDNAELPSRGLPEASSKPELPSPRTEYAYLGSVNSDKYHLPSCSRVSAIREENRIGWASAAEAEAEGREPCKICKPGQAE